MLFRSLVAHFCERDDTCGDEERFHSYRCNNRAANASREMPMTHTFPGPARKVWSSVSPGVGHKVLGCARHNRLPCRHLVKSVDVRPCLPDAALRGAVRSGRLLPNGSPHCSQTGGRSPPIWLFYDIFSCFLRMILRPAPGCSRWSGDRGNRSSTGDRKSTRLNSSH